MHLTSNIVTAITSKRVRLGKGRFGYLAETTVWRDNIKVEFRETKFRYKINYFFHKLNMKVMFLQFVQNCSPSSYHVKRHTVQQTTPPYLKPNRRLTKRKNPPDAYIHVYRNVGIRVNWTNGSCTTCILNPQYAGYFET